MKSLYLTLVAAAFFSASVEANSPKAKETSDYKPLTVLTHHCASCHNQPDHPGAFFLSSQKLSDPQIVRRLIEVIETSTMPPAHGNFKNTADGKTILRWLKKQSEKREKP